MHRATFLSIVVALAAFVPASMNAQAQPVPAKPKTQTPASRIPRSYKDIKYPPLNEIKVPEPVRFELGNGMVVHLVEDHELPIIGVTALIRTGNRWEPAGKTGLAAITGTVMRTGGTATRSGDHGPAQRRFHVHRLPRI